MEHTTQITPADALTRLQAGHQRLLAGRCEYPHSDAVRRAALSVEGQHPFATIVGCSDSRVPVEVLFDQGFGDLFVVRVAGNVCNDDETASVEYAVEHLGTPLVVVLGHTRCGAVTAVVSGGHMGPQLTALTRNIRDVAGKVKQQNPALTGDDLIEATVRENVLRAIADLKQSPGIAKQADAGAVRITGAIYDLATGALEWLGSNLNRPTSAKSVFPGTATGLSRAVTQQKDHQQY